MARLLEETPHISKLPLTYVWGFYRKLACTNHGYIIIAGWSGARYVEQASKLGIIWIYELAQRVNTLQELCNIKQKIAIVSSPF
jgi:hypothetical protein